MTKSLTALVAAATMTLATLATPTTAEAGYRGGWWGPAFVGGAAYARPYYGGYCGYGGGCGYGGYGYGYGPAYAYYPSPVQFSYYVPAYAPAYYAPRHSCVRHRVRVC